MPRETSRKATVRADATLNEDRAVQLQSQRRFFSNQGNDQATRQARALQNAFTAGVELKAGLDQRSVVEGRREAITGRGAGEARRADEENEGYNAAWDQMDAESDLNLARKELPELLRGADAENLDEAAVQTIITDYMKSSFEGITADSAYGNVMAPGLLTLEAELIGDHRDTQLQNIQMDQRSTMLDNMQNRFEASATVGPDGVPVSGSEQFDYDYLGDQTNVFFDGAEKRIVYWESIYDFAIKNGRPDIIENVPERFASGDPTGINDPLMQDEHRAAISAATTVAGKKAKAEQDRLEQVRDDTRFNIQMAIYDRRQRGENVRDLINALAAVPGTELSDISSAKNFGDGQLDENESRSGHLGVTSRAWTEIHSGNMSIGSVWELYNEGFLGSGPQAEDTMRAMMDEIQSVRASRDSQARSDVAPYRTTINKTYNPQLGGALAAIDPLMQRVNVEANVMYNQLVGEGKSGFDAYSAVREKYDDIVKNAPDLNETELTGRRTQTEFTRQTFSPNDYQRVLENPNDFNKVFGGAPRFVVEDSLIEQVELGNLTREQAIDIFSNYD